ncbi:hypothetical protein EVAR_15828_1 [Eumeta japonica]|uniref:Uncharacterized protein n=1 Tax=Eumeta variegata TaxID=151549 RepID=A0A4C1UF69_EUMVA|nr:hypothetical protein EVAR_15828_1 [Eumeta japonica]
MFCLAHEKTGMCSTLDFIDEGRQATCKLTKVTNIVDVWWSIEISHSSPQRWDFGTIASYIRRGRVPSIRSAPSPARRRLAGARPRRERGSRGRRTGSHLYGFYTKSDHRRRPSESGPGAAIARRAKSGLDKVVRSQKRNRNSRAANSILPSASRTRRSGAHLYFSTQPDPVSWGAKTPVTPYRCPVVINCGGARTLPPMAVRPMPRDVRIPTPSAPFPNRRQRDF